MSEHVRRTACNRDCPDACSLLVTVRDGRGVGLRGDPDHPVTRGFLCERTSRFLARQYDPARLSSPRLRRGADRAGARGAARFEQPLVPIGWDEALELAAERLAAVRDESGPAAILHYRSGGSLGLLKPVADYLFERFGPVTIKHGDICSGASEAAQTLDFGVPESNDLFDTLNSRLIVLWGKNLHTSSVHALPVLREARARGCTLVGLDPVRTRAAELCELFLRPRPGADFWLAMGLSRWLFDHGLVHAEAASWCDNLEAYRELVHSRSFDAWVAVADVAPRDAARLAELYGTLRPAAIHVGWGLGRRRNGCQTTRALDALGAITGNVGIAGGGVSYTTRRRAAFDLSFVRGESAAPRTFAEPLLGPAILAAGDPPIRAVWVTAGNPVAMLPDSHAVRAAFAHSEFNVVVDTHPTDTTDVADLVLPTLTLLEDSDVLGAYGNHWLHVSEPALAPPLAAGGAAGNGHAPDLDPQAAGPRHELHILQALAARLGLTAELAGSLDDWKRRVLRRVEEAGVTLEALRRGSARNPFAAQVLFEGRRFLTPSGRANLLTTEAPPPPAPDADFPLTLMATSTPRAQSSQWSVPQAPGPPELTVHPDAAPGCAEGQVAVLRSRVGELRVTLHFDPTMRRDVAWMPKGGQVRDGHCANVLVAAAESDAGSGAAYYDECVGLRAE
ncbi:MAG TPA: molybdopterin-dependent oxidoreductase [Planctomycetota bacterium]|nr:molybdopterin-dependent oxidoreductase [Planctomycetota bacterium]